MTAAPAVEGSGPLEVQGGAFPGRSDQKQPRTLTDHPAPALHRPAPCAIRVRSVGSPWNPEGIRTGDEVGRGGCKKGGGYKNKRSTRTSGESGFSRTPLPLSQAHLHNVASQPYGGFK